MSQFASPRAPGGGITWDDHKGALLLIEPKSVELDIITKFGKSDAVKADIAVLDGPDAGATFDDCLIFPKLLQAQTNTQLNQKILARLGQGRAKDGQDPPWVLEDVQPDDEKLAEAWVAKNRPTFVQPDAAKAPF